MTYELFLGDALDLLARLPEQSVEAMILDLPYGTTACSWDSIIPFAPMWAGVKRVLKPRGVFVTTASQPFTSKLVMSNLEWFKQELIWDKVMVSSIGSAKFQHLRTHENILLFYENGCTYNFQSTGRASKPFGKLSGTESEITGAMGTNYKTGVGYPKSIIRIPRPNNLTDGGLHPTQKPVSLYEYLILTYTNPGDTVLDFCFGSCTTGVACMVTGRRFIGGEKDPGYFKIGESRLAAAAAQPLLPGVG
jgi:site-specific DNA-methyltransferase (adenine-specific)